MFIASAVICFLRSRGAPQRNVTLLRSGNMRGRPVYKHFASTRREQSKHDVDNLIGCF